MTSLEAVRSVLFLPASNPRAIDHARNSAAGLVILDLEDAVKPDAKHSARDVAVEAVAGDWPMPVAIRINSVGSEWHSLDIDAVAQSKAAFAVLPRASSAHLAREVAGAVSKPLLAMIETATGVLAAAEIAPACAALIAGTNDLRADLRVPDGASRDGISASLQMIVLAARAAGIAAFDGVYNQLDDLDGLAAECGQGRALGFDGKTLIHPRQIETCNRAFAPGEGELERARRLVAVYDGGAERFEDEMIERMHIDAAKRLLGNA
ncbi:CoA ester lyase [Sphingomonas sabuli]|uniref:CoA ester lyase n=1 Tax=Sphingomonas sabuli TaxID=2764186 RepID=A0A7G9L4Q2_9SPHN|nr:CoA ester lyase [Sphingomonas sabuli]QNM83601.1 CoA ester lyase [Sphingomonas sabuli]